MAEGNLAAMRPGETPVPMPNTTVKTRTAESTALETVREGRWPPGIQFLANAILSEREPKAKREVRIEAVPASKASWNILSNHGGMQCLTHPLWLSYN